MDYYYLIENNVDRLEEGLFIGIESLKTFIIKKLKSRILEEEQYLKNCKEQFMYKENTWDYWYKEKIKLYNQKLENINDIILNETIEIDQHYGYNVYKILFEDIELVNNYYNSNNYLFTIEINTITDNVNYIDFYNPNQKILIDILKVKSKFQFFNQSGYGPSFIVETIAKSEEQAKEIAYKLYWENKNAES